jgi:hypothetical protein
VVLCGREERGRGTGRNFLFAEEVVEWRFWSGRFARRLDQSQRVEEKLCRVSAASGRRQSGRRRKIVYTYNPGCEIFLTLSARNASLKINSA